VIGGAAPRARLVGKGNLAMATRVATSRIHAICLALRRAIGLRRRAFPSVAGPDRVFVFRVRGVALELPRAALTPEIWVALKEGWYENDEVDQVRAVLRPGDSVLELGAGIGFVSAVAARQPGISRVVAVEANPQLLPIARRTHALNGVAVDLVNAAVVRDEGEVEFHLHPDFWASSTVPRPGSRVARLPARSLSSLVAEARPDVLIVDIEGGEASLFEGAALGGVRAVVMELHPDVTGLRGVAQAFGAMATAGFAYDPGLSRGQTVVFARAE
jgi:FkbM family methyltransferase